MLKTAPKTCVGASNKVDKRIELHKKVLKAFTDMQLVCTRGATVHVFVAMSGCHCQVHAVI